MASIATTAAPQQGRGATTAGWIISGIVILFLATDGLIKLVPLQPVTDTMRALGWPTDPLSLRLLGVLILGPTLLYAWRRTALVGAILLTAFLGGAVATQLRIGAPLLSHTLFPLYHPAAALRGAGLRETLFEAWVDEALAGNQELQSYVQRLDSGLVDEDQEPPDELN